LLKEYSSPGNVRELEHFLIRARVEIREPLIEARHVERMLFEDSRNLKEGGIRLGRPSATVTRDQLVRTLQETQGNKREAARRLRISPSTVYALLRRYRIEAGRALQQLER
jgi:DNA-binding NtrC family response regulator